MSDPFARRREPIPVSVITDPETLRELAVPGVAVITVGPPVHAHEAGSNCPACESRSDIRALLFELDERLRRGMIPPFERVIVDTTGAPDATAIADALVPGRRPASALRDHVVARNYRLDETIR
jgi:hypothetical protein